MVWILWIFVWIGIVCGCGAVEPVSRFAAVQKLGTGSGESAKDAAAFKDPAFWSAVQQQLERAPVTVTLAPGVYRTSWPSDRQSAVLIRGVGHEKHSLTIRGAADGASVFQRDPADDPDPKNRKNWPHLLVLRNCRNVIVENLRFAGGGVFGYGLQIRDSQDITVRNCHWKDLPLMIYAATGANGKACRNILWENCTFDTLGYDSHAHMIYNANGCRDLTVRGNDFRDCAGDYVRFRNGIDGIVVENNTFLDNGKYSGRPFVSFPLFIDFDEKAHYEYFPSRFVLRGNTFEYREPGARNAMILWHISGFNPPGASYLFSRREAAALSGMTPEAGRAFLAERLGLKTDQIIIEKNRGKGKLGLRYESQPAYGAEKQFPKSEYSVSFPLDRFLLSGPEAVGAAD